MLDYLRGQSIQPRNIIYTIMYMLIGKGLNIQVIDFLNFLPMKLAALPKVFGLEESHKGWFPHFFNTAENQEYIGSFPSLQLME